MVSLLDARWRKLAQKWYQKFVLVPLMDAGTASAVVSNLTFSFCAAGG
jgi:hypothetical protein